MDLIKLILKMFFKRSQKTTEVGSKEKMECNDVNGETNIKKNMEHSSCSCKINNIKIKEVKLNL